MELQKEVLIWAKLDQKLHSSFYQYKKRRSKWQHFFMAKSSMWRIKTCSFPNLIISKTTPFLILKTSQKNRLSSIRPYDLSLTIWRNQRYLGKELHHRECRNWHYMPHSVLTKCQWINRWSKCFPPFSERTHLKWLRNMTHGGYLFWNFSCIDFNRPDNKYSYWEYSMSKFIW